MTRRQASVEFGIAFGTLCGRIWRGLPMDKIFTKKERPGQWCIDMFGMRLSELARKHGLRGCTIYVRVMKLGWEKEKALIPSRYLNDRRGSRAFIETWEARKARKAISANRF